MESEKIVKTFYQVVNDNSETIAVKSSLKEAKEFAKSNNVDATFLKPDFVINADQEKVILYGVTQKTVHAELVHFDDFLWANEEEARKFFKIKLLDFKEQLKKNNPNDFKKSIESESEFKSGSSYLIFSHYEINL